MKQWHLIIALGITVCLILGIFLFSSLSSFSSTSEGCEQRGGICLPDCRASEMQVYHSVSCPDDEECCMRY